MAAVLVIWAGVELKNYIAKKEAQKKGKKGKNEERYEELRAETARRWSGYRAMPGSYEEEDEDEDEDEEGRRSLRGQLPSYEQSVAADAQRASSSSTTTRTRTRRRPNAVKRRGMPADPSLREAFRSFVRRRD
ncbi:Hypothetical predicted protein [Lecanosticta acicola]|uniref:Uncharacterized protein n=1 Tax=Lecanosticta acicola TaxID=111012 RepID=A0AAI8YXE6_9PEZI|nr:Hypothetical predicted protein [Lecanosticta acicola]